MGWFPGKTRTGGDIVFGAGVFFALTKRDVYFLAELFRKCLKCFQIDVINFPYCDDGLYRKFAGISERGHLHHKKTKKYLKGVSEKKPVFRELKFRGFQKKAPVARLSYSVFGGKTPFEAFLWNRGSCASC